MPMTSAELRLHQPNLFLRWLEAAGLWQVTPADICPKEYLESFYNKYPPLRGDDTAIGAGDDGGCQAWRDPGWWKEFVPRSNSK